MEEKIEKYYPGYNKSLIDSNFLNLLNSRNDQKNNFCSVSNLTQSITSNKNNSSYFHSYDNIKISHLYENSIFSNNTNSNQIFLNNYNQTTHSQNYNNNNDTHDEIRHNSQDYEYFYNQRDNLLQLFESSDDLNNNADEFLNSDSINLLVESDLQKSGTLTENLTLEITDLNLSSDRNNNGSSSTTKIEKPIFKENEINHNKIAYVKTIKKRKQKKSKSTKFEHLIFTFNGFINKEDTQTKKQKFTKFDHLIFTFDRFVNKEDTQTKKQKFKTFNF